MRQVKCTLLLIVLILKIPASYSKKHLKNQPNRSQKQLTYKDFKYLDDKSFKQELESTDCSLATDNNDLDLGFNTFFSSI